MQRIISRLLLMAAVLVVLAACGGGPTDLSDDVVVREVELAESHTWESSTGTFEFRYPENWVIRSDEHQLELANTDEALDVNQRAGDQVVLALRPFQVGRMAPLGDLSGEATAEDVLAIHTAMVSVDDDAPEFESINEILVSEHPAVYASASSETMDLLIYAVDLGNGTFALWTGTGAPNQLYNQDQVLEAVVASTRFAPVGVELTPEPLPGAAISGSLTEETGE
jgi:predicted small lipoprotein YifL